MKCVYCGYESPANTAFCPNCGAKQPVRQQSAQQSVYGQVNQDKAPDYSHQQSYQIQGPDYDYQHSNQGQTPVHGYQQSPQKQKKSHKGLVIVVVVFVGISLAIIGMIAGDNSNDGDKPVNIDSDYGVVTTTQPNTVDDTDYMNLFRKYGIVPVSYANTIYDVNSFAADMSAELDVYEYGIGRVDMVHDGDLVKEIHFMYYYGLSNDVMENFFVFDTEIKKRFADFETENITVNYELEGSCYIISIVAKNTDTQATISDLIDIGLLDETYRGDTISFEEEHDLMLESTDGDIYYEKVY